MSYSIHLSPVADLDPVVLYKILWLRVAVFVVEQQAAYDDLDGRDIAPGTELMWAEEDGAILATLRILEEPGALWIGRVATSEAARGRGVGADLMQRAIDRCGERMPGAPIHLGAQARLEKWYGKFGFVRDGETYYEDDIPHIPMTLV